ncbi:hypothetical protein TNIN_256381 [Trichonephila inaurata madagascariensis]|uniref:Uncharacterized protein n=1 Tax=Trichonephila inaurata madagascariensis TaxID=2747483 RepID=A0A8X6YLN9_9ARAC|nr:hypothetical protein TNIN_256381 [Trichonephila inaurata madagascariensis]
MNELNTRFVYGLRFIDRGISAGRKLCAVLNPALSLKACIPPTEKTRSAATTSIGEKIMNDCKSANSLKSSHLQASITFKNYIHYLGGLVSEMQLPLPKSYLSPSGYENYLISCFFAKLLHGLDLQRQDLPTD